jgi:sugar lactone lactonase YvrE
MQLKKWICGALAGLSLLGAAVTASAAKASVSWEDPPQLTVVAKSSHQWTGVAVTPSGRIFVCFPSWGNHPDYHVGEILTGEVYPYRELEELARFTCVQSVVADTANNLWVLDAGKRTKQDTASAAPRLLMVGLSHNEILRTYDLPSDVALPDSMMTDVRIDTARGVAYITDSGHGGIIVLDLNTANSWRALTDIPEVQSRLQAIYFPTGLFSDLADCNGLELSDDKKLLYFSSLGGDVLYAVPTVALLNENLSVAQRQKEIKAVNVQNVPADGMVLRNNALYMGALSYEGIWEFRLDESNVAEAGAILNLGVDLRWPDSFARASDNSVYFTTSALNYPVDQQPPYELYHMVWPEKKPQHP